MIVFKAVGIAIALAVLVAAATTLTEAIRKRLTRKVL